MLDMVLFQHESQGKGDGTSETSISHNQLLLKVNHADPLDIAIGNVGQHKDDDKAIKNTKECGEEDKPRVLYYKEQ